jgi:hypothetical protein
MLCYVPVGSTTRQGERLRDRDIVRTVEFRSQDCASLRAKVATPRSRSRSAGVPRSSKVDFRDDLWPRSSSRSACRLRLRQCPSPVVASGAGAADGLRAFLAFLSTLAEEPSAAVLLPLNLVFDPMHSRRDQLRCGGIQGSWNFVN